MRGDPLSEVGVRYNRLIIVSLAPPDARKRRKYFCRCDCGAVKPLDWYQVKRGFVQSCGCWRKIASKRDNTTHGEASWKAKGVTPEYKAWQHIISRCTNPNDKSWGDYGGRGISICQEWRASYPAFLAHVGRKPSPELSIDRINNDGNYEPGNVRWATRKVQNSNKRPRKVAR